MSSKQAEAKPRVADKDYWKTVVSTEITDHEGNPIREGEFGVVMDGIARASSKDIPLVPGAAIIDDPKFHAPTITQDFETTKEIAEALSEHRKLFPCATMLPKDKVREICQRNADRLRRRMGLPLEGSVQSQPQAMDMLKMRYLKAVYNLAGGHATNEVEMLEAALAADIKVRPFEQWVNELAMLSQPSPEEKK